MSGLRPVGRIRVDDPPPYTPPAPSSSDAAAAAMTTLFIRPSTQDLTLNVSASASSDDTSSPPLYTLPVSLRSFPSITLLRPDSNLNAPPMAKANIRKLASNISCHFGGGSSTQDLTLEKKSMGLRKPSAYAYHSMALGGSNMVWKRDQSVEKQQQQQQQGGSRGGRGSSFGTLSWRLVDEEGRERARLGWDMKGRSGDITLSEVGGIEGKAGDMKEVQEKRAATQEKLFEEVLFTGLVIVEAKWRKDIAAVRGSGGVGIVPSAIGVSGGMGDGGGGA